VGGFKEIYSGIAFLEEADFCLKLKKAGYLLIFEPKAAIWHFRHQKGGNRAKDVYELRYWIVHNYIIFTLENYGQIVTVILAFRQMGWAVLSSIKRKFDKKMFRMMMSGISNGYRDYYRFHKMENLEKGVL
jgi:GT2 family glycosyltransferase